MFVSQAFFRRFFSFRCSIMQGEEVIEGGGGKGLSGCSVVQAGGGGGGGGGICDRGQSMVLRSVVVKNIVGWGGAESSGGVG